MNTVIAQVMIYRRIDEYNATRNLDLNRYCIHASCYKLRSLHLSELNVLRKLLVPQICHSLVISNFDTYFGETVSFCHINQKETRLSVF
jgi:hypothetical protein